MNPRLKPRMRLEVSLWFQNKQPRKDSSKSMPGGWWFSQVSPNIPIFQMRAANITAMLSNACLRFCLQATKGPIRQDDLPAHALKSSGPELPAFKFTPQNNTTQLPLKMAQPMDFETNNPSSAAAANPKTQPRIVHSTTHWASCPWPSWILSRPQRS